MERTIIYDFTQEDYDLLKKKIPDNPCTKCDSNYNGSCCGCYKGREYSRITRPYKENNILDFAHDIKRYYETLDTIKKQQQKLKELKSKMPKEIIENVMNSEK